MNYKNYYTISAVFMSLVALLSIPISAYFPIFEDYHFEVILSMFLFILLEWLFLFIKDKKTIHIKNWYDDFMNEYHYKFNHYREEAMSALNKFVLLKVIVLQIYFMLLISTLCSLFIMLDSCYSISDILETTLYFYIFIIFVFILYIILNSFVHKKYYFCYLEPKNENYIYILMTYYLLQIKNAGKLYLNYHDFINTSASLTRILHFKESLEFLNVWRSHLKKMNPLFSFIYIEHCLFDFVMLGNDQDTEAAYKDYNVNLIKHKKYKNNKNIERCTYFVDILYAYHKKDYQRVIDLNKRAHLYFKENDYQDSHQYILYQSYLHIDENMALQIYNQNTNNPYFKELL